MKALTLHRPWPVAIFYLLPKYRKNVENRSWPAPMSILGKRIAIHAGSYFDNTAFESWLQILKPTPDQALSLLIKWKEASEITGIIGTVRVYGCGGVKMCFSPWATGPYCWMLSDPVPLPKPIPCKGAQGLWTIPTDIEQQIEDMTMKEFEKGIIDFERAEG